MLKFKMSLLLNSMKFKVTMAILLLTAIVVGIIYMPSNKAGNITNTVNIVANETGIKVAGNHIYTMKVDGNAVGYDSIYCIEEGEHLVYNNYNAPIEITNAKDYFINYNSAMWILNNMYVSTTMGTNGLSNEMARDISAMNLANLLTTDDVKKAVKSNIGVDYSGVTPQKIFDLRNRQIGSVRPKNALDVVGQIALWNYTKNVNATVLNSYKASPNELIQGTNLSNDEQTTLKYVYYALTYLADKNSNTTPVNNISNYTSLDKSQAKFDSNTRMVGPYSIKVNGVKSTSYLLGEPLDVTKGIYPASAVITKVDGTTVKVGSEVFVKKDNGDFYIDLSKYADAKSVNMVIDYVVGNSSIAAYALEGGEQQNLLALQKKLSSTSLLDTKEIPVIGNYSIELVKVKKDGTTVITTSEAEFSVNGTKYTTSKGKLSIASGKEVKDANQVDTYEIKEVKAPEGYNAIEGSLKINVGFKLQGTKYVIDNDKVVIDSKVEGSKVEVSEDNSKITVYIPNEEQPGKYNVELYKVDEKGNVINSSAKFNINGSDAETKNGKIVIASNVEITDEKQVNTYTIKEVNAPENYMMFDGTITLKVGMTKKDVGFGIDEKNIELNVDKENSGVTFKVEGSTVKVYVPNYKKKFDFALRKFITKIDGEEVKISREPSINKKSIEMLEETGTASYYHVKNSLAVKIDNEIEYTIRIYNEGEIESYAKQITDYLPEGLTFVKLAESNSSEYTTKTLEGSRVVVIDYNGNTNIKSLRNFFGKEEVNVTSEYYQEVKLICKVNKTEDIYITSRAEITNYGYSEKDAQGNVIWKEAKEINNVDIDSIQNTISKELNLNIWYENAKELTYVDSEGKTIVDKNYYPGTQDDDDFETVELLVGKYNVIIKKVDSKDSNMTLQGAYFNVSGSNIKGEFEVGPTSTNGEVVVIKGVEIRNDNQLDEYVIKETKAPVNYNLYEGNVVAKIATMYNGESYVIDVEKTKVDGKNVKYVVNDDKTVITIVIPNEKKEFDLSLRKFITTVNNLKLAESREPQVDVSKLASGESTTATYNHSKVPVELHTTDIVTYTIRVYNEGEISGYANRIMDDIPQGLEFVPATYDEEGNPTNINAKYKWIMYKEVENNKSNMSENEIKYNGKTYVITDNVKEADVIVTDYLSNNDAKNLIKAFDSKTMKQLDYKDVKVSFKVVEPSTSDRIVINYAQITEDLDEGGKSVTDRDSTPNEWNEGEDDQDIEKVRVRYFDLSLLKWVTKAIVYENGYETITETGHTGYEKPEPIVKVDLKNTSLNNVEVKFEYTIRITNEGEIAGYAKEISDYIPEGLKFIASDNEQWKEVDGKIVTRALENTLLQPGEHADVKVILTWINDENNLGIKTNIAEISEDYNDYGTKDIDSTPNNKVDGEDDIDDASVMLAIKTGEPVLYIGISIAVLAVIAAGIIIIKKKVLV